MDEDPLDGPRGIGTGILIILGTWGILGLAWWFLT